MNRPQACVLADHRNELRRTAKIGAGRHDEVALWPDGTAPMTAW